MSADWILYGASGTAGQFIATHAVALGLEPILAGRDAQRLAALSEHLGLRHRVASLDEPDALDELLAGVALLVNCAGPYSVTSTPLVEACLREHVHYVDLCNEPLALEQLLALDEPAKAAEILILPGVGHSIIPSDCLVRRLRALVPDGERLELALAADTRLSNAAVASSLHVLERGPLVRRGGELVRLARPACRNVVFGRRSIPCLTMPTAELTAACATTGIPDITVFVRVLEQQGQPLADYERIAALLQASLELGATLETPEQRLGKRSSVWARLTSSRGERAEATLDLPEPLAFTATAVCDLVCHFLENELPPASGATTLADLLGPDFVLTLPGVGGFGLRRTLRA